MFYVIENSSGKIYKVFKVCSYDGDTRFLIYKNNEWFWCVASNFEPFVEDIY